MLHYYGLTLPLVPLIEMKSIKMTNQLFLIVKKFLEFGIDETMS